MSGRCYHGYWHSSLLRWTSQYLNIYAEYHGVNRYEQISRNLVVAATGEFADFQEATRQLKEMSRESELFEDGVHFSVEEYANYLAAIAYERRNKQNPFYNNFVVAGF